MGERHQPAEPLQRKEPSGHDAPKSAHILRRIAALVYDSILLAGILFAATAILLIFNHGEAFKPGNPLYTAALILVSGTFFTGFWTHGGQTLGMRAWKIRIEQENGAPCTVTSAVIHLLAGVTFGLLLGIGWWFALFHPKGRALQDVVARTRLIRLG